MKRRIRKIVNFFAFNLLFFALYLNFIHKDKNLAQPVPLETNAAMISNSTHEDNKVSAAVLHTQASESKVDQQALKLSIN